MMLEKVGKEPAFILGNVVAGGDGAGVGSVTSFVDNKCSGVEERCSTYYTGMRLQEAQVFPDVCC